MATTKRSKRGRAAATSKKRPGPRAVKGKAALKAKPIGKPKLVAKTKKASPPPKRQAPRRAIASNSKAAKAIKTVESVELTALKGKFNRERSRLEKSLTDAVREIGLLRHHELRVTQLERQLAERDATIGRLQTQLTDLERRPVEPVYVHEVQQTLALGGSTHAGETAAADLDEFEDEQLPGEAELATDED